MQSLVPSLSLNNLIPLTFFFSVVFLSLHKTIPLRVEKNKSPPDRQKQDPAGLAKRDPSGLVKTGPLRIGKNRTPPDWQNWDPYGLAKIGPLRIGKIRPLRISKIGTPPDWQNWGPLWVCKNSLSGTFLNFLPKPFRIRSPMPLCCLN